LKPNIDTVVICYIWQIHFRNKCNIIKNRLRRGRRVSLATLKILIYR